MLPVQHIQETMSGCFYTVCETGWRPISLCRQETRWPQSLLGSSRLSVVSQCKTAGSNRTATTSWSGETLAF